MALILHCLAIGCYEPPLQGALCTPHWNMVPLALQPVIRSRVEAGTYGNGSRLVLVDGGAEIADVAAKPRLSEHRTYRQRFKMHARLSKGGSLYVYAILDGEKVIGERSAHRKTSRDETIVTYSLGDQTFTKAKDFIAAYEGTV